MPLLEMTEEQKLIIGELFLRHRLVSHRLDDFGTGDEEV